MQYHTESFTIWMELHSPIFINLDVKFQWDIYVIVTYCIYSESAQSGDFNYVDYEFLKNWPDTFDMKNSVKLWYTNKAGQMSSGQMSIWSNVMGSYWLDIILPNMVLRTIKCVILIQTVHALYWDLSRIVGLEIMIFFTWN